MYRSRRLVPRGRPERHARHQFFHIAKAHPEPKAQAAGQPCVFSLAKRDRARYFLYAEKRRSEKPWNSI
jgi:hypothetical protein